jgi:hypothetical protein
LFAENIGTAQQEVSDQASDMNFIFQSKSLRDSALPVKDGKGS